MRKGERIGPSKFEGDWKSVVKMKKMHILRFKFTIIVGGFILQNLVGPNLHTYNIQYREATFLMDTTMVTCQ